MAGSFEEWVLGAQGSLINYAYLLCGDREEARDLVQDVLSAVSRRYDAIVADGNITAYAKRCVTNDVISARRRSRPVLVSLTHEIARPAESDKVPDKMVAWQLCAELPPRQRAAVVLRFWEDASFAEISELLDIPESTARSHVHRALATLRERLGDGAEETA